MTSNLEGIEDVSSQLVANMASMEVEEEELMDYNEGVAELEPGVLWNAPEPEVFETHQTYLSDPEMFADEAIKEHWDKNAGKMVQAKSFEVIITDSPWSTEEILHGYNNRRFGVYAAFGIRHTWLPASGKEGWHDHIGIILRDKNKRGDLRWDATIRAYFRQPDGEREGIIKAPFVAKLKGKGRMKNQLSPYFLYCVDKSLHDNQEISDPICVRWDPPTVVDASGVIFSKLDIFAKCMYYFKAGKTIKWVMDLWFTGPGEDLVLFTALHRNISAIKKMYVSFTCYALVPEYMDLSTYSHRLVKYCKDNWDWKKTVLILSGASGAGKTEFARVFLKSLFPHLPDPFAVDQMEAFQNYSEPAPLIYDDLEFRKMDRSCIISFLDQAQPRTIDIKYGSVRIRQHTPKILTTNLEISDIFPWTHDHAKDKAINRRVFVVDIKDWVIMIDKQPRLYMMKGEVQDPIEINDEDI